MEIKYFSDTDTLLIVFTDREIVETRDINENTLVEFDRGGELVSMTIEHAKNLIDVDTLSFLRFSEHQSLEIIETQQKEIDRRVMSDRTTQDARGR